MRNTVTLTLVALVLMASSFYQQAASQETRTRDGFFERLLVGGAERGVVYFEIPLKPDYFAKAKTLKDRWGVWDAFFARVLLEHPDFTHSGPVPYWGDFVYQKVDWSSVASAVDLRVGDVLQVRTPTGEGSAKVIRYAIHYNGPGDTNLLLGVAQPLAEFKVIDTDFLVAAPRLPPCGSRCTAQAIAPRGQTLKKISEAVSLGAKIPSGQQIKHIIALQGSFTRPAPQYVVYVDFGKNSDTNLVGYWRTVILDSDFSIIAVISENEYSHIQPHSVSDVDGDGLDEVWVELQGYEGHQAGLIYWRGGTGSDAFRYIANAYNGA